jgi:hypothetical protein
MRGAYIPDQSASQTRPSGLQSFIFWRNGLQNGFALAVLLIATPVKAEEAPIASSDAPVYTLRTPVEIIAADPAAAAVLNRDLPGLLTNPSYPIFKTMSLKQMQEASGGDLSVVDINKALADLQMLPGR